MNFREDHNKITFKCKKCGNCCRNSRIRLSPYDILIICKELKITTSELHQKYTSFIQDKENQDLLTCMLKTEPKCLFLTESGCKIYTSRPLGCRTFPLATQPFYDGKTFKNNFYVLEECAGFDTGNKISVGEIKEKQGIYSDEIVRPWIEFKVKVINTKLPNDESFQQKFLNICYNFDGEFFQSILKQNNLPWPKDIDERHKLIIRVADKLLLEPYC